MLGHLDRRKNRVKIFVKYLTAYFWVLNKKLVVRSYKNDGTVEHSKLDFITYVLLSYIAYHYMYESNEECIDSNFHSLHKESIESAFNRINKLKGYSLKSDKDILFSPIIQVLFAEHRRWIWFKVGNIDLVFFQDSGNCRLLKWSEYRKFLNELLNNSDNFFKFDEIDVFLYKLWEDSLEA